MPAALIDKFPEIYPYRVYMDRQRISYDEIREMFGKGFEDRYRFATLSEWETVNWVARRDTSTNNKYYFYVGFNTKENAVKLFLSKEWD